MTIRVYDNIPIPEITRGSRNRSYPFETIKVGESFFVEGKTARTFGGTVRNAMKKTGKNFVYQSHEITEDGKTVTGVMVWRKPDQTETTK